MTVEGYDLSHWDGISDYSLVGKGFVIIKVTEGTGYVDPSAGLHLAKAKAAGVMRGAYHFTRDDSGIDAQAKYFVAHAPADYTFLVTDNEGPHVMTDAQLTTLILAIRKYDTLNRPILSYMSDSGFLNSGQDYNYVAKWGSTPPSRPWLIWQYQSGSAPGSGGEDHDRYAGSLAQLTAILGGGTMGDTMNSYNVPKVPSDVLVATGKTLWPNDAMSATDTSRIIVSPGRRMPYHGGTATVGIVEYVNDTGVHTGKTYFAHPGDLTDLKAIPMGVDDGFTKATQDAAVLAQKAADDTACAQSTTAAVAAQAQADKVVIDAANAATAKAQADLVSAAAAERERLAQALGKAEADEVRNS